MLIRNKDPELVFFFFFYFMETKVEKVVLERVGRKTQFSNLLVVPHHNLGGGLALLWQSNMCGYMYSLILISILVLLLTMELATIGSLQVFMSILKPLA